MPLHVLETNNKKGSHFSGSIEMNTQPGREFAQEFNAIVVSGTYRLAPEHTFPASFNDGWQLATWLTESGAEKLGGNLSAGFIIGGHSAGGHIAAVVSQLALNRKLDPPVTGSFLGIPKVLDEAIVPEKYKELWGSWARYGASNVDAAHGLYKPDVKSPMYSPFNAENAFKGQCRTYIQVCELDPLRDDGVVYEAALKDNGVPVKLDLTPNADHQTFCVLCDPKVIEDVKEKAMAGMKWLVESS